MFQKMMNKNDKFCHAFRLKDKVDKWTDQNKSANKFEHWRLLVDRLFNSYQGGTKESKDQNNNNRLRTLNYAATCMDSINLNEVNENDELVHASLINNIVEHGDDPNKLDTDILYELMGCIDGELATNTYITLNFKRSGMEFWRRILKNSDPKTYGTVDNHLAKIRSITKDHCKSVNELRERMNELELAYDRYFRAGGTPASEAHQKHELLSIIPMDILSQWGEIADWGVDDASASE